MSTLPIPLRPIKLWEKDSAGRPRWGRDQLIARWQQGKRSFERGFRLKAFSDDESTFPSFSQCRIPGLVLGDLQRRRDWPCVIGVDLSSKKRPGNALVAIRVDPSTRRRYPIDVRFLAKPGPQVCEHIAAMDSLYGPTVIKVEDNSYQDTLFDWIGDQKGRFPFWVKVEPTTTTSGRKGDSVRGLPGLEVEFSNSGWCFPLDEYEGQSPEEQTPVGWWARLDHEFRLHPIAATSDGVMACWFGRQAIEEIFGIYNESPDVGDINAR